MRTTFETPLVAITLLKGSGNLTICVTLSHIRALIVQFFTYTQTYKQLYAVILVKIQLQRNERCSFGAQLAVTLIHLTTMQQHTTLAIRIYIPHIAVAIGMDMHPMQPTLTIADQAK